MRWKHVHILAITLILGLTMSGCAYWRLYLLTRQLAAFEEHFSVTHSPHPIIHAYKPVMEPGDITSLTGIPPSIQTQTGTVTILVWDFQKTDPEPAASTGQYDVAIAMAFTNELLFELHIPERFKRFITMESLAPIFSRVNDADINRRAKKAAWKAPATPHTVMREHEVLDLFGPPLNAETKNGTNFLNYVYTQRFEHPPKKPSPPVVFDLKIRNADHLLVHSAVRFGELGFAIDLTPEAPLPEE